MRFSAYVVGWKAMGSIALVVGGLGVSGLAVSQTGGRGTSGQSGPTSSTNSPAYTDQRLPSLDADVFRDDDPSMRLLRQNARRDEMKKRMEQNAQRLLLLTAELRNDLQTREPTEADGKRLEEIARLAHAVREQMKQ